MGPRLRVGKMVLIYLNLSLDKSSLGGDRSRSSYVTTPRDRIFMFSGFVLRRRGFSERFFKCGTIFRGKSIRRVNQVCFDECFKFSVRGLRLNTSGVTAPRVFSSRACDDGTRAAVIRVSVRLAINPRTKSNPPKQD